MFSMLEPVLAATLAVVGAAGVWWLARAGGPYRTGPWPGLTPRGAALLLAHALLLAAAQVALGRPQEPLPDLVLLAVLSLAPVALATRLVQAPGVASAVCGAFLLPRTIANLLNPTLELAPLLIVPAVVFDVATWLRPSDLAGLRELLPGQRRVWRRRERLPRRLVRTRAAIGGVGFGVVLVIVEAGFSVYLGGSLSVWNPVEVGVAAVLAAATCGLIGAALS
jgi:hypothetical protein